MSNGSPGCDHEACCNAVCAADPFCCDVEWDGLCATGALKFCGNAACPGDGDCCVGNGTPGCDDAICCKTVCLVDPFCCDVEWDGICAGAAQGLCDLSCPWDCGDGDVTVGIVDFLALLGQWGGAGTCDFDGGGVGITDFLALLGNWGPCP